jgi:hypothetical protein
MLVMESGKDPDEGDQRIGCRTPEYSRMDCMVKSPDGDDTGDLAPQRGAQDRFTGDHLSHIGDDNQVARKQFRVGFDKRVQVACGFLFAFDNYPDPDRVSSG